MICRNCGQEVSEDLKFCENCGTELHKKQKKLKFKVAEVVNKENVLKCSNRVAYIASGWAYKVRKRGIDLGILIIIIYLFMAIATAGDMNYNNGGQSAAEVFFLTFGVGILYGFLTMIVLNTVAFIIRMGAEVIQLLDDIKNK